MWRLHSEQRVNEEGVAYIAYGFICGECCISDFSSVREETEHFIEVLNRNEVSPLHIYEVIEDHFAEV
ncbi:MAG: hypothetical protein IJD85_09565 [Oscillospiraceae bacterium]|nr:hypothetical protein [Oscillospiraceae bacterium]